MNEYAKDLTVVMPCLNEEKTIGNCIDLALDTMRREGVEGEVLVVDNGSADDSVSVAEQHGARVVHEDAKGYGYALNRGFKEALGKYIVFADADESYDFSYVGEFYRRLRSGKDLVIGNRLAGKMEKGAMPWLHRYLGTPVLTLLVRVLFKLKIRDINCGMRGITKEGYNRLELLCGGMEFASEMMVKAKLQGLVIDEFPINFKRDKRERPPHLNTFRDGWRHMRFILLFAPKALFLLLGLSLLSAGFLLMLLILLSMLGELGIFTMLVSQSLILLGAQFVLYGVSSYGFSQFINSNRSPDKFNRFFRNFTIDKGVLLGCVLVIVGGIVSVIAAIDLYKYMVNAQEILFQVETTKWGFMGITLMILGIQTVISSFYLCLFNIKKIYHN